MKTALVVGAGYLGERIIRMFQDGGWHAKGASLNGGDGLLSCDVGDPESVAGLPGADAVVHCASSGRGGEDAYRKVYFDGCRNLVERFPDARLLFTSSTSVYAQTDGETVTEDSETAPDRETGRILLEAERVVLAKGGVVARLAGIYGPGRSVLLRKFLDGSAVIEEDGARLVNQIHRDDAAKAIFHLLSMWDFPGPAIFNVCDSESLSQLEVYQGLARMFGKDLPPSGARDMQRKRGWTHKRVSNAKLRATGWEPDFPSFLDAAGNL